MLDLELSLFMVSEAAESVRVLLSGGSLGSGENTGRIFIIFYPILIIRANLDWQFGRISLYLLHTLP